VGDVLLAIPALRAARRRWPDEALALAAQPRIGRLLTALGVVDRSVDFDALGLAALFEEPDAIGGEGEWPGRCAADLREAGHLVSWFGSREPHFARRVTALVPEAVIAPSVGSDDQEVWRHLLSTVGAAPDRAMREPVSAGPALVAEGRLALQRLGWDGRGRLLVVHPGAGGAGKLWATEGFAAVLDRLARRESRLAVVVHRGPADSEAVAALSAALGRPAMVLEEPDLTVLAGVLSAAAAYIGNDSGISHLAATLGVPSVVLFTAERITWRPWAEHVEPQVVSIPTPSEADVRQAVESLQTLLDRQR
jgi:ADP-heptose:LPS heptosyltransferase